MKQDMRKKQIKNGLFSSPESKEIVTLKDGEKMSDGLARVIKNYSIGDLVTVFYKGKEYQWRKQTENSWRKIQENGEAKTLRELKEKIKLYISGKPLEQFTEKELKLLRRYSKHFEVDSGHVHIVKHSRKRNTSAANPKRLKVGQKVTITSGGNMKAGTSGVVKAYDNGSYFISVSPNFGLWEKAEFIKPLNKRNTSTKTNPAFFTGDLIKRKDGESVYSFAFIKHGTSDIYGNDLETGQLIFVGEKQHVVRATNRDAEKYLKSLKDFRSSRNPKRRNTKSRRNSSELFNEEKIDALSAMFQGKVNGKEIKTVGSDYTPQLTSRIGKLSLLVIKNGKDTYNVEFNKNAWLSMDARKNLYIDGKDARINGVQLPRKGELFLVGQLQQINYITDKAHIENGRTVEYFHELGEVDNVKPNVFIDSDGFPLIVGGNYDIGAHGIEN
jgi:hypothetical protein